MVSRCKSELMLVFFSHHSPFAVLIDLISMTRIWVQLLFNIRWLIYYLLWSIAHRNSHFSFLYHMSEANASYLEWNGKCFITKLLHLKRLVRIGWSTPFGVWSILRHCRKIWSTADAVWSKAFSGFMFFLPWNQGKKNGGERGIRTLGKIWLLRRFSKPLLSATQPSLRFGVPANRFWVRIALVLS